MTGEAQDSRSQATVEVVVLLTSEVVTNAVVHGGPHGPADEVLLNIELTDGSVRVSVRDHNPKGPEVEEGHDGGGRGVLVVDRLASAWGIEADGAGKWVWFEVLG